MSSDIIFPDIEKRFLPPKNWKSDYFINEETSHKIHYSFILPEEESFERIVILLPGLSEFTEKYIETTKFFTDRNFGVYIIDWAYQGRSTRFHNNPHKRHSDGYDDDLSDLNLLVQEAQKHGKPLYMLAHSMGAHLGLRYLSMHPETFKAASLTTPMQGIKKVSSLSLIIAPLLKALCFVNTSYIPFGKNWHKNDRELKTKDIFSSDPTRKNIHHAWSEKNKALQLGSPTLKWLQESLKSISALTSDKLKKIETPILIFLAEKEAIVDNNAIRLTAKNLPNAKLIELKNAKHELLMETDNIRDILLQRTLELFNQ